MFAFGRGLTKSRSGAAAPGMNRQISGTQCSPAVQITWPLALTGAFAGTYRAPSRSISTDAGSIGDGRGVIAGVVVTIGAVAVPGGSVAAGDGDVLQPETSAQRAAA